jgi:hypothetical protein
MSPKPFVQPEGEYCCSEHPYKSECPNLCVEFVAKTPFWKCRGFKLFLKGDEKNTPLRLAQCKGEDA